MAELPDTRHLKELLAPWSGKTAFVVSITDRMGRAFGNNGDRLMLEVFELLLKDFKINVTLNKASADVIVVPPSGALLEVYAFPNILAERLRGLEDVPVVIFPSSVLFPATDPSFMFAGRRAAVLWILREPHSYDHLRKKWGGSLARARVTLELDHDVVVSGHEHVPRILRGEMSQRHVLIASRIDGEAQDMAAGWGAAPGGRKSLQRIVAAIVRNLIPYGRTRTFIARMVRYRESKALGARMMALLPAYAVEKFNRPGIPIVSVDASVPSLATFDEYSQLIREAAVVITNRLHIALPATILGKQVFLVDSGYHKLRGVYERSLQHMSNIQLLSAAGATSMR